MTRKTKEQISRDRQWRENVGREAADDLRWRMDVLADPKHPNRFKDDGVTPVDPDTPDIAIMVAWLVSHFDVNEDTERALLDHLELKWERTRMGQRILRTKRSAG